VSGGVGHNKVTLHLESQFSKGASFLMKIYRHYIRQVNHSIFGIW